MARSIARAVRGESGMDDDLAALAQDGESAVATFDAEFVDVAWDRCNPFRWHQLAYWRRSRA